MKLFDSKGRVALVTGGNGGIGLGMATGMAEARANIVVARRDRKKRERAVAQLLDHGKTDFVEVNVQSTESCAVMVTATIRRFGRLDILVNNAGANVRKPPGLQSEPEWRDIVDVSLTSVFLRGAGCISGTAASRRRQLLTLDQ